MNANRYRLIFDKRTGMLIPVAEFTSSTKKGNGVHGDRGGYLSGTVTMPVGGGWSTFVGLDAGAVQDNFADKPRDFISGWAFGVRGNWRNASVSLVRGDPIKSPHRDADAVLYGMATLRF